jgi:hypothetical protein
MKGRLRYSGQIMEENIPQKEFLNFYKDVGIKRELTTPYNLQQNGVAKQKNITIVEAVKTMIHDQDLSMCLWVEVTREVVYV